MAEDGFKNQLTDARRAVFEAGMSREQALTAEAVETLAWLMAPELTEPNGQKEVLLRIG